MGAESASNCGKPLTHEEQQKIDEVRLAVSPLPEQLSGYCTDASIARYLRVQNWNVQKASKMLKESLKWRSEYKPEEISWEDIASEAESGKVYRSTSVDKKGRAVLVMRPCCQNSDSVAGQIKYMVYCLENAIFNLPPNQEEMIWLVDFRNFSMSNISMKVTKELAHTLQSYYPERLGLAILYHPPWIFEQFYKVVKLFLEPETRNKVKFVYPSDSSTTKIMEALFDIDQLESAFGGKSAENFDIHKYAQKMKDDERRRADCKKGNDASASSSYNSPTDVSSQSDKDDHSEHSSHNGDDSTSS